MKVYQVTLALLVFALFFAIVVSTAPNEGWVDGYSVFVERTYRFFDALLHILGVAALLKYLYSRHT